MNWHLLGWLCTAEIPTHWNEGFPLETIAIGSLAALVTKPIWENDQSQAINHALLHNRMVEAVLNQVPLLPARFSTPISLCQLLEQLNQPSQPLERLAAVRGCREYGLRIEFKTVKPEAQHSSGRAYLEALAAQQKTQANDLELALTLQAQLVQGLPHREWRVLESSLQRYRLAFLVKEADLAVFAKSCQPMLEPFKSAFSHLGLHGAFAPYGFITSKGVTQ